MKRSFTIFLTLMVALAFTGMVYAQAKTPAKGETPKASTHKVIHKTFKGMVVSTDATANTLVVKAKKVEKTFAVDPACKMMIGKKECKLADLAKDTKVTVTYKVEEGKNIATAIK